MGRLDNLMYLLGFGEDEDEDEYDYELEDINYKPKVAEKHLYKAEEANEEAPQKPKFQVVLVKPKEFEEVRDIADNLLNEKVVIVGLDLAEAAVGKRIIDFLSGIAYAKNGSIKRVATQSFMITAYPVDFNDIDFGIKKDKLDYLSGMF